MRVVRLFFALRLQGPARQQDSSLSGAALAVGGRIPRCPVVPLAAFENVRFLCSFRARGVLGCGTLTGTVDPPDLGVLRCACFCLIRPEQGAILCCFLHIKCALGCVGHADIVLPDRSSGRAGAAGHTALAGVVPSARRARPS